MGLCGGRVEQESLFFFFSWGGEGRGASSFLFLSYSLFFFSLSFVKPTKRRREEHFVIDATSLMYSRV